MEVYLEKHREIKNSFYIKDFTESKFPGHWHISVELLYILDGEVTMGIGEQNASLTTGDLVVCSSNEIHYYEKIDATAVIIIFHPSLVGFAAGWPDEKHFPSPFFKSGMLSAQIKNALKEVLLYKGLTTKTAGTEEKMLVQSGLLKLCALLQKEAALSFDNPTARKRQMTRRRMQSAVKYLEEHSAENITLAEVARYLSISPYHLSHMFKENLGMTMPSYINSLRTDNAKKDVLDSEKTMTEIALTHGFGSVRSFNREYKKHIGCTPFESRSRSNA